jgi:hypothetical protein
MRGHLCVSNVAGQSMSKASLSLWMAANNRCSIKWARHFPDPGGYEPARIGPIFSQDSVDQ